MDKNHPEKNYKVRILVALIILAALAAALAAVLILRKPPKKNPQETPQKVDRTSSVAGETKTEPAAGTAVTSGSVRPEQPAENEDVANGVYMATLYPSAQESDPTYITSVTAEGDDLLVTGVMGYYQNGVGEDPNPDRVTTYGTIQFRTNDATRYMSYGGDSPGEAMSRESFLDLCSKLNGLGLAIEVENGEVKEASVSS